MISSDGKFNIEDMEPTPLCIDPSIKVIGTIPSKCFVFKSALCPLKITFKVQDGLNHPNPRVKNNQYNIMFKRKDDVRQDQLVLQMINLMDHLLQ